MTTFTWTYIKCSCIPMNDLTDVVRSVEYLCTGIDNATQASIDGRVTLADPDPNNFTLFANLTFQVVDAWVKDALGANGITSVEACIQGQINSIVNPPVVPVKMNLPF